MIKIDEENSRVIVESDKLGEQSYPMDSPEAFEIVSKAWLRAGWDTKYVYSFTWMGRPIIQLPDDMFRIQEIIYTVQPDLVIETGIAHGGSLIFYASLLKAMGHGRIIGVDVDIRPHNQEALECHPLFPLITMIEGSSIDPDVVVKVRAEVESGMKVIVILDSNHSRDHVLEELRAYGPLVSPGAYIIAADGIMKQVKGGPRTAPDWDWNNPAAAAEIFVKETPGFEIVTPSLQFNEGVTTPCVTYCPGGYIKRLEEEEVSCE